MERVDHSSSLTMVLSSFRLTVRAVSLGAAFMLLACSDKAVQFPADAEISKALQANFEQDPNNAKAKQLVGLLGGDKGAIEYRIRRVILRQGAFEAQYDVSLRMGQSGAESLQKLYASMIPKDEAARLPEQSLAAYEKWLESNAAAAEKTNPQQAAALRNSMQSLSKCYAGIKVNDSVALMDGLGALVSPARDGWYAEKLQSPGIALRCLPL